MRLLKKQDFDIFHPTYYEPYFLKFLQKKPYVVTVYDMIHELFPQYFKSGDQTTAWKKLLIENAGAVIAISENTRQDIIRFTDIDPDRIRVIHLGNPLEHQIRAHNAKTSTVIPAPEKSYLLFVGGRGAYKNFDFFIRSIAGLLHEYKDLHVVSAGSLPFSAEEKRVLEKLHVFHKVHHVNVNDRILKNLYDNALAFIFPSLYEGFGLPILEAFSSGCPTVLSNASSFPEIGGDGALYFEPGDSESIVTAIETVISQKKIRDNLIEKGYTRLNFFSWEKNAGLTKKVYRELL